MIGVFDSGIGGLTVLNKIQQLLPQQALVYVADQAYSPYGDQSEACVQQRSRRVTQWLIDQGADIVVIACNTATAIAIDPLRSQFNIPIVGVEPGVKPAALKSQTRKIGILATENTVASSRYKALIQQFLPNVMVISQGCSGLADAIEKDPEQVPHLLERYVTPLLDAGVDQIVLGCTHYPLIASQIETLAGHQARIVDTSEAIAQEVKRRLPPGKDLNLPTLRWYSTRLAESQADLLSAYDSLNGLSNLKPAALDLD